MLSHGDLQLAVCRQLATSRIECHQLRVEEKAHQQRKKHLICAVARLQSDLENAHAILSQVSSES